MFGPTLNTLWPSTWLLAPALYPNCALGRSLGNVRENGESIIHREVRDVPLEEFERGKSRRLVTRRVEGEYRQGQVLVSFVLAHVNRGRQYRLERLMVEASS